MNEEDNENKKINKLIRKMSQLDDVCSSIYVVLLAKKSLRFNELYRSVIRLNPKQKSGKDFISRPTFNDHLKHLTKQKLVVAKKKAKQNVIYSLNREAMSILTDDSADISEWIENLEKWFEPFNAKKYYAKQTEKSLEQEFSLDLNQLLKVNLLELRAFVNYDLKIDEKDEKERESGDEFWRFVGNPLYRIVEKHIADKCRDSVEYRKKFFEKLEKLESLLKEKSLLKMLDNESGD